jgi:hypothetical protein
VRSSNGLLGLIGVVLLAFVSVAFLLTRAATGVDVLYIAVHAIAGILALVAYLSAGLENLQTFLGERSTK